MKGGKKPKQLVPCIIAALCIVTPSVKARQIPKQLLGGPLLFFPAPRPRIRTIYKNKKSSLHLHLFPRPVCVWIISACVPLSRRLKPIGQHATNFFHPVLRSAQRWDGGNRSQESAVVEIIPQILIVYM